MPYKYGGRRSKGCNLCRKRKVRCGEEKPVCKRCERLGKDCVYRDEVDLLFHDETAHTSKRAERMWLARAKDECPDQCMELASPRSSTGRSQSPNHDPGPLYPLKESLRDVALSRFLFDYISGADNSGIIPNYLGFTPELYSSCDKESSLAATLEAVAFANYSCRYRNVPGVTNLAADRYGKALGRTSAALRDPKTMLKHETVLSCHLLGMYELLVPNKSSFQDWNKHNRGAMTLLKLRGVDQLNDPVGNLMFKQIYATELVGTLRYCSHPMDFQEILTVAHEPVMFMIFSAMSDTSRILADYRDIIIRGEGTVLEDDLLVLHDLLARSEELQERIKMVLACLPPFFSFERAKRNEALVSAPPWLQRVLRDKRCPEYSHKKYKTLNTANCWNWLRHSQIRLLQVQILTLTQLGVDGQPVKLKLWDIESLIDDLMSTVAYFLTTDSMGNFSSSTKIEDVRGIRYYFLMRALAPARLALEFNHRRGEVVGDKLDWLEEVHVFLKQEFGAEPPSWEDPIEWLN